MEAQRDGLDLIGVPVDNLSSQEVLDRIETYIAAGGFHQIATANVNFLVNSLRFPELHQVLGSCDLVVPDGMPLLWFSRWMQLPLAERVPGVDLIPQLARLSALHGYRIYFLGSSEESSIGAAGKLRALHPGVQIVGYDCPPILPLDQMDNDRILAQIEQGAPDILLVGFGNPKQELWLARLRHRLKVPVCIGIGGSLDMLSGNIKRAPEKYQRWGLEWFYRIVQEPRRLLGRYMSDFIRLLRPLATQILVLRLQGARQSLSAVEAESRPGAELVTLYGGLTSTDLGAILPYAETAMQSGRNLVLDLAGISYVGPDAIQWIIRLGFALKQGDRSLWLIAPQPAVMRVLRASRVEDLLCIHHDLDAALERIALDGPPSHYDDGDGLPTLHPESTLQRARG